MRIYTPFAMSKVEKNNDIHIADNENLYTFCYEQSGKKLQKIFVK